MACLKRLGSTHLQHHLPQLSAYSRRGLFYIWTGQDSTKPPMPIDFNLNKRPLWLTLSKAALKLSWMIQDSILHLRTSDLKQIGGYWYGSVVFDLAGDGAPLGMAVTLADHQHFRNNPRWKSLRKIMLSWSNNIRNLLLK